MKNLASIVNTQKASNSENWQRFTIDGKNQVVFSTYNDTLKIENRPADIPQFSKMSISHWEKLASSSHCLKVSILTVIFSYLLQK